MTMTYEYARDLPRHAQGVRFFSNVPTIWHDPEDEMTARTLEFCVRDHLGDDAEGYSDAELWADVIVPMIADGRIDHAVWGVIS